MIKIVRIKDIFLERKRYIDTIDKIFARPNILQDGEIYKLFVEARKEAYRKIGFQEKTLEDYLNQSPGHCYFYEDLPNAKEEAIRIFLLGIEDLYNQVSDTEKLKEALIKCRGDIRNDRGRQIAYTYTLSEVTLDYSICVESYLKGFCKTAGIRFATKKENYDNDQEIPSKDNKGETIFTMSLWVPFLDREVHNSLKESKYYKRFQPIR